MLTTKQKAFVEAFAGNATKAARAAGYTGTDATLATQGGRLLRNPEVRAAIDARPSPDSAGRIATRAERQAFWTRIMDDAGEPMQNRLKASELLGKAGADFTEKVQVSGKLTLEELVLAAARPESEDDEE